MTTSVVNSGVFVEGDEDDPLAQRFRQLMEGAPRDIEKVAGKVLAALKNCHISSKRLTRLLELAESTHNQVPLLRCVGEFACKADSTHPQFQLWQQHCRAVLTEVMATL